DQVVLDPAASGEATVRPDPDVAERAGLVPLGEADPEVVVLDPEREAGEQLARHEVAPPAQHRGDAHVAPPAHDPVWPATRALAASPERTPVGAGVTDAARAGRVPRAIPHHVSLSADARGWPRLTGPGPKDRWAWWGRKPPARWTPGQSGSVRSGPGRRPRGRRTGGTET